MRKRRAKGSLDETVLFSYCIYIEFEYYSAKSDANKIKHGIDFEEAQNLWEDTDALEAEIHRAGEPRWLLIAEYGARLWTAIITYRNVAVRIISVRRSRKDEEERYEQRKKDARSHQR